MMAHGRSRSKPSRLRRYHVWCRLVDGATRACDLGTRHMFQTASVITPTSASNWCFESSVEKPEATNVRLPNQLSAVLCNREPISRASKRWRAKSGSSPDPNPRRSRSCRTVLNNYLHAPVSSTGIRRVCSNYPGKSHFHSQIRKSSKEHSAP